MSNEILTYNVKLCQEPVAVLYRYNNLFYPYGADKFGGTVRHKGGN